MAILTNGVETIEVGSRTWRIICNNNFQKLDDLIGDVNTNYAKKDLSNVDNDVFKDKANIAGLAYQDLSNIANTSLTEDIVYTDETKGLVLVDRSDTTKKYRLYVDSGNLQVEQV